jgi:hypothetical protein
MAEWRRDPIPMWQFALFLAFLLVAVAVIAVSLAWVTRP